MNQPVRILYVDDYPLDRELVRDALEKEHGGFELVEAASRPDFEAALAQGGFDLVLSDFNILGFEGLQVLETVRLTGLDLPVIIVTGTGSEEVAAEAIKRGAADYVIKTPKHIQRLPHIIHAVLDKKRLEDEHKLAEEELKKASRKWQTTFDATTDGIYLLDRDHRIIQTNKALRQMLNIREDEAIGKFCWQILHGTSEPIPDCPMDCAKKSRQRETVEYKIGERWFEFIVDPVLDADDVLISAVHLVRDITERKQAEEKIRLINAELEQRVEERTRELREAQEKIVRQEKLAVLGQLAGGVSHELRNPLGVINSAVYYLKLIQPEADNKIRQYHAIIEQEVHNADKIISDLLDFARLISADRQPLSVPDLVQRVLRRFPVPASLEVALELPANLPRVFADPRHMEQVLGNLTDNACQAMDDRGKLTISALVVVPVPAYHPESRPGRDMVVPAPAREQQKDMVAIAVKDTGVGVPPENMKKLFEPLFTTKINGIGLGLAVSKKLAEANGGRIEVLSEPGKGSTFTLVLPVQEVE